MSLSRHFLFFLRESKGASAIEYAFLAAMIALAIVGVLPLVGVSLNERFQAILNAFS